MTIASRSAIPIRIAFDLMATVGNIVGPECRANCRSYAKVSSAYKAALSGAAAEDRLVVFGSFATVAGVLSAEGIQRV